MYYDRNPSNKQNVFRYVHVHNEKRLPFKDECVSVRITVRNNRLKWRIKMSLLDWVFLPLNQNKNHWIIGMKNQGKCGIIYIYMYIYIYIYTYTHTHTQLKYQQQFSFPTPQINLCPHFEKLRFCTLCPISMNSLSLSLWKTLFYSLFHFSPLSTAQFLEVPHAITNNKIYKTPLH